MLFESMRGCHTFQGCTESSFVRVNTSGDLVECNIVKFLIDNTGYIVSEDPDYTQVYVCHLEEGSAYLIEGEIPPVDVFIDMIVDNSYQTRIVAMLEDTGEVIFEIGNVTNDETGMVEKVFFYNKELAMQSQAKEISDEDFFKALSV